MGQQPNNLNVTLAMNSTISIQKNGSGIGRLSELDSPIMQATGHDAPVMTCCFSPDGKSFASGSIDRKILLWNSSKDCKNYGILQGHKGAVTQVKWADLENIFTSSSDNTICHWSHETGERVTKYVDHTDYVNCLDCHKEASHTIIASGSDDATLRLWDSRVKKSIQTFKGEYQVFSTALNKDNNMAFSAGVDGKIYAWDIRANSISFDINAHQDAITGIKLSPDGLALLTFSANNALNIFDIRLGIPENTRLQNSFAGCVHGFEKNLVRPCWSPDGYHVACGSADMTVMVWDVITKNIVYKLPGHKGAINEVDWWDNLLLSCSNDQTMFIGEIDIESVNI